LAKCQWKFALNQKKKKKLSGVGLMVGSSAGLAKYSWKFLLTQRKKKQSTYTAWWLEVGK
jgi:hypothetical protein